MILEKIKNTLLKELFDYDVSIASIGFSTNTTLSIFCDKRVLFNILLDTNDYLLLRVWYEQLCNAYEWVPYECDMEDRKYKFSKLSEERQIYLKMRYK